MGELSEERLDLSEWAMARRDEAGQAEACVLAATPLLTVTLEEERGDGAEIHLHAGGQGFWVARMMTRLGAAVTLCGAFGGETGAVVRTLIEHEGVTVRAVSSRSSNGAYIHDRRGGERKKVAEASGPRLSRHELDDLYGATLIAAMAAGICVITGVPDPDALPPDGFRRLATDLTENGVTVVADLSGKLLDATLAGGVVVLKISHEELVAGGYAASEKLDDLVSGMEKVQKAGARDVVVSRADQPTIALISGELVEVIPPRLEAVEPAGGGDSMTAGLAVAIARGLGVQDALRLSAAAGGLNVTRRGLATGHRDDIERLASEVTVRRMS